MTERITRQRPPKSTFDNSRTDEELRRLDTSGVIKELHQRLDLMRQAIPQHAKDLAEVEYRHNIIFEAQACLRDLERAYSLGAGKATTYCMHELMELLCDFDAFNVFRGCARLEANRKKAQATNDKLRPGLDERSSKIAGEFWERRQLGETATDIQIVLAEKHELSERTIQNYVRRHAKG